MNDAQQESRSTPLQCCQGMPAPAEIIDGWNRLTRFPENAVASWWSLLEPALRQGAAFDVGTGVADFAEIHALREGDLLIALHASAFLVNQAAALDLPAGEFRKDLDALSGGAGRAAEVVMKRYDEIRPRLRASIIEQSLLEHGKVLVGLDWRLDQMAASNRGVNLETPVLWVTLHCRDAAGTERLTLQVTPESLGLLKELVARFGS